MNFGSANRDGKEMSYITRAHHLENPFYITSLSFNIKMRILNTFLYRFLMAQMRRIHLEFRGTQREYSSKPLKSSIVERTLVF